MRSFTCPPPRNNEFLLRKLNFFRSIPGLFLRENWIVRQARDADGVGWNILYVTRSVRTLMRRFSVATICVHAKREMRKRSNGKCEFDEERKDSEAFYRRGLSQIKSVEWIIRSSLFLHFLHGPTSFSRNVVLPKCNFTESLFCRKKNCRKSFDRIVI